MERNAVRIRGPQSKNGCFTCKARRIKCDEERPTCLRCARSTRVCEGYRETERDLTPRAISPIQKSSIKAELSRKVQIDSYPSRDLALGYTQAERERRFSLLGTRLLVFHSFESFGDSGVILDTLVPQLCHTVPSVNTIATALGAAYHLRTSSHPSSQIDRALVASLYQESLRAVSRDLATQQCGPIPVMIMCIMLCRTEVFLKREPNALFHLQCAFELLHNRRVKRLASSTAQSKSETDPCSHEDDIETVFRTLDFQICSYALDKPPYLPGIPLLPVLPSIVDLASARTSLIQLVHTCYEFTSSTYKWKYHGSVESTLSIQQGRYIAHLSTWLENFNLSVLPTLRQAELNSSRVNLQSHGLILRMTALSALIHVYSILSPKETSYDIQASHFQQVIRDGEVVLAARHREPGSPLQGVESQRFANGPGLIQPLFHCALKYRHPIYRRRAISLLKLAAREGPWFGPREACIASRVMMLEEKASRDALTVSSSVHAGHTGVESGLGPKIAAMASACGYDSWFTKPRSDTQATKQMINDNQLASERQEVTGGWLKDFEPADISESVRINTIGMEPAGEDIGPRDQVIVRFFRCLHMETLLAYGCGHGNGEGTHLESHPRGPCRDNPHWEMWEEVLEFCV